MVIKKEERISPSNLTIEKDYTLFSPTFPAKLLHANEVKQSQMGHISSLEDSYKKKKRTNTIVTLLNCSIVENGQSNEVRSEQSERAMEQSQTINSCVHFHLFANIIALLLLTLLYYSLRARASILLASSGLFHHILLPTR